MITIVGLVTAKTEEGNLCFLQVSLSLEPDENHF